MSLLEYGLLSFVSLFVIMDPVSLIPVFLAMTPANTPRERTIMAVTACVCSCAILLAFAYAGTFLFRFLGITVEAFQIAGGLVLLVVALDMLQARKSAYVHTDEEMHAGAKLQDVAITPLAVPMLAGPGAITTVILLNEKAASQFPFQLLLAILILLVCFLSGLILAAASKGAPFLSGLFMKVLVRIMGLLLAAISIQFIGDGIKAFLRT